MSFPERLAAYRRLALESRAWALLRADNAPLVLAFAAELFAAEREVQLSEARALLGRHLFVWKELGNETDTDAAVYVRTWIEQGWFREAEYRLTMTDACQVAMRFADGLQTRDLGATASHLRIVQDAVQALVIDLTGDVDLRKRMLYARRAEIDTELALLKRGHILKPTPEQQRERTREVLQLARTLTGDFRHLEEEIRRLDQEVRQEMIESQERRGEVVEKLLDQEDLLADSPAGRAFEGFFQLLCDDNRSTEFREQLRVVGAEAPEHAISAGERAFLGRLFRELVDEGNRVFDQRRRTWESLRAFVESGADRDHKRVESLLADLFKAAITLSKTPGLSLRHSMRSTVGTGRVAVKVPSAYRLALPREQPGEVDLNEHATEREVPRDLIQRMRAVRVKRVASRMREQLRQHGDLTLGQIALHSPIAEGLEELVVRYRVAKACRAIDLQAVEILEFQERDGRRATAKVPMLLLRAAEFPDDVGDLSV